ncbi:MAG: TetR family transcriptional regulator [Thermoanaerobaculia bacterium]|nr:TetR family transcriptional regulator [Thermoanaerobaculia bacterium]
MKPKTAKAERTRGRILDAALELLRERGYEGTTMRRIARRAGTSVGSAYYYFPSKGHLVQAFYARTHQEHLAACEDVLASETRFERRLAGVLEAKLDTIAPYHRFSGVLFKTAADPESPLNPFSDDSQPTRRQATELFRRVVEGSDLDLRGPLARKLPDLLWSYHMGVILFWIHDRSPGMRRSYRLAQRTVEIVARLVRIANLPPMRPLTRAALELLRELEELEPETEALSKETADVRTSG